MGADTASAPTFSEYFRRSLLLTRPWHFAERADADLGHPRGTGAGRRAGTRTGRRTRRGVAGVVERADDLDALPDVLRELGVPTAAQ